MHCSSFAGNLKGKKMAGKQSTITSHFSTDKTVKASTPSVPEAENKKLNALKGKSVETPGTDRKSLKTIQHTKQVGI